MKWRIVTVLFNTLVGFACLALAWDVVIYPKLVTMYYKNDYQVLMFQCDNVMRDHLIAKNRVVYEKTEASVRQLASAEIGLLSCHEYDKVRKKLMMAGVSKNELTMIGLEAIEETATDIKKFVEIHEFKY